MPGDDDVRGDAVWCRGRVEGDAVWSCPGELLERGEGAVFHLRRVKHRLELTSLENRVGCREALRGRERNGVGKREEALAFDGQRGRGHEHVCGGEADHEVDEDERKHAASLAVRRFQAFAHSLP
ncbi:hypothetical protein ACFPRL_30685 [Pseudoclavibacter helvolus]